MATGSQFFVVGKGGGGLFIIAEKTQYMPPAGDEVNFLFEGSYSPPLGDEVNFNFDE